MKKLTNQQIFDKAVLGVVRQGALSTTKSGHSCKYRVTKDDKTLACGVGQLIDDDLYDPAIEGAAVDIVTLKVVQPGFESKAERLALALCFSGIDTTNNHTASLLSAIQTAHDVSHSMGEFVSECRVVARNRRLKMPAIK